MRYEFIHSMKKAYPITVMCEVLEVSQPGFYSYLKRLNRPMCPERLKMVHEIKEIHRVVDKTFGSRRMAKEMANRGYPIGRFQARSLMAEAQTFARFPKKYRITTNSDHKHSVYNNLLNRNFQTSDANQVWVSDITYCWTAEGWVYLAVVLDLYSRKVVGWAIDKRMKTQLVIDALMMAIWKRKPGRGLIVHSDQGVQYASTAVRRLYKQHGILGSMSRRGDCWDNAVAERFFRSLKSERLRYRYFETRDQARQEIINYIEMFYNGIRLHSYLDYMSPNVFEKKNEMKHVA